ncbi:MAG TPA: SGNH/GDSL hydrolase family protein [Thermoleophilaceae bacterium]|jgi:lysophospholipase L1-like esterase|nr:SGNH/GDSL hydrolase family protein [Thermoleophilaceae bacterium]
MKVRRFVAMGDSFTAGTEPGGPRWPDDVARLLDGSEYVNLARARARSDEVVAEQLPRALALRPDLVSLICGANDVLLTTRPDLDGFAATFSDALALLRGELPAAHLVTATYPEVSAHFPLRPRSRRRVARGMSRVNRAIREAAQRHGAVCLDFADHPERGERANFAEDGFHPSPNGHRKAAAAFVLALREQLGVHLAPEEAMT